MTLFVPLFIGMLPRLLTMFGLMCQELSVMSHVIKLYKSREGKKWTYKLTRITSAT